MKVIYQKNFPDPELPDLDPFSNEDDEATKQSRGEIQKYIEKNHVFIQMPERAELSKLFTKKAIEFSNFHKTSIKITKFADRIEVAVIFDFICSFSDYKDLLLLSDEIQIFHTPKCSKVLLLFFTHKQYSKAGGYLE